MFKLRILIVEDNRIAAEDIASDLEDMGYEVVGKAIDVDQAVAHLEQESPDLVLVDINLGSDESDRSGIDLAEMINQKYKLPFIYMTGYSDVATVSKAKHTNPHAYLTKPIKRKELYANIEVAFSSSANYLLIKDGHSHRKIKLKDILWLQADGNYKKIYTQADKFPITARMSMEELEDKLPSHRFLRIHKSYIVNIEYIDAVKGDSIQVTEQLLPVGRAYLERVQKALNIV